MYSLRFAKTYDFGIMEKNHIKHVLEDKFYADDKVFCIADGVTRDFKDGTIMKHYPQDMEEVEEILEKYPEHSGAADAAEICVNDVSKFLVEKENEEITGETFDEALEIANEDINKINEGRKINYTSEDEYCCVAVGGVIDKNYLNCFSIGDSGIIVLDKEYNEIFNSLNYIKNRGKIFANILNKLFPNTFNFNNRFFRKYCRKHRNDLLEKFLGRSNFGVLNGQEKALNFIQEYKVSLKNAKYILAFSDGCEELINSKEKVKKVLENPRIIKEALCEKTLIIYESVLA